MVLGILFTPIMSAYNIVVGALGKYWSPIDMLSTFYGRDGIVTDTTQDSKLSDYFEGMFVYGIW